MLQPGPDSYLVHVDEAGDRGWGGSSSPVFVLSALVTRSSDQPQVKQALLDVRTALDRHEANHLHWAKNLRDHGDRKMVARRLADLPATTINVVLCKESLYGSGTRLNQSGPQYNYMVRFLLERISWLMESRNGQARLRFAHVKGLDYAALHTYLDHLTTTQTSIDWSRLKNGTRPEIGQPSQLPGLQVADLLAGCTYAAVCPDRHGDFEPTYLTLTARLLWAGRAGNKVTTYGLKFMGGAGCTDDYSWLPDVEVIAHQPNAA